MNSFYKDAAFRALSVIGAASTLAACSGSGSPALPSFPVPLSSCPITSSSIDSLNIKGTGTAFNGAAFGSIGTYTYYLAEATGKVAPGDACAATVVDLKNTVPDTAGNVRYTLMWCCSPRATPARPMAPCSMKYPTGPVQYWSQR